MIEQELLDKFRDKCAEGINVYFDYDNVINSEFIRYIQDRRNEIYESWRDAFEDVLYNWLNPIDNTQEREEKIQDICREVGIDWDTLDSDDQEYLRDEFSYNAWNKPDLDHYLKQKICVDIFIDSGDYNLDLGCNQVYPHYNGDTSEPLQDECCLVWLATQQGYSKEQLQKNLYEGGFDNKFFEDVYDEINNCTSHMNSLVFLKRMTLEEYLKLKDGEPVHISKNDRCGLFDRWSGAGGLLDIHLEKDIDIDPDDIHSIEYDEGFKYNIHDVYGVTDNFWEGD